MNLTTLLHESFIAFQNEHAATLDAWEQETKARLLALAEHHRRALGQSARNARVRLLAADPDFEPRPGDPDYMRIHQDRINRFFHHALHRITARERLLRLVADQPLKEPTP